MIYFTLTTVLVFSLSQGFIHNYVNDFIKYPKCCRHNHHLGPINTECYDLEILEQQISANKTKCKNKCVELINSGSRIKLVEMYCNLTNHAEITKYRKFPKCCLLGHAYDTKSHTCVKSSNRKYHNIEGLFLNIGLINCKPKMVIVDYFDLDNITVDTKSVTLRNGKTFSDGNYCFDESLQTGKSILRACETSQVCKKHKTDYGVPCFKKCCPDGQIYLNGPNCISTFNSSLDLDGILSSTNEIQFGILIAEKMRKIRKKNISKLDEIGNLHFFNETPFKTPYKTYNSIEAPYCVEILARGGHETQILFQLIKEPKESTAKLNLNAIVLSISCIFLALTIFCYAILPEMHNLYGKSVIIYCLTLLIASTILAFIQFGFSAVSMQVCYILAFLVIFFFFACFTWQNVICFDMWIAFGQVRSNRINKNKEKLRFFLYNLYAWGVPIILTSIIYLFSVTNWLPEHLNPHIGQKSCFFHKEPYTYDHLIFFVIPLTIMILINSYLFIKTILYCFKVKNEINKMRDSMTEKQKKHKIFNADKDKLFMLLKLFTIMGISWLFEVVSSLINFHSNDVLSVIEYIWDVFNGLQGCLIFCIFILKKRVLSSLKARLFHKLKRRRTSESSTTMTSLYSNVKKKESVESRKISETRKMTDTRKISDIN